MTITARTGDALPRVTCKLVGEDGNAFAILGRFRKAARKAGWTPAEVTAVMDDATSSDYDHLLGVVLRYVDEPDGGDE
jgi:hypothetical protein